LVIVAMVAWREMYWVDLVESQQTVVDSFHKEG